jgi:hypothetical protein
MAQLRAIQPFAAPSARVDDPRRAREVLYKSDYPRGIDRYIDFFGDGAPGVVGAADRCGEALLECLA